MTTSGLFMAALWNRAGHDIFALWFRLLSIFFFFSSPNLNGRRTQIGCLPYFYTINQNIIRWNNKLTYWLTTHGVVWPSANLECRSEMCCSRLAGNAALKNRQKFAIWAPSHNYVWLLSSQLRHVSTTTIGKNVLNSNVSPHDLTIRTCPGMRGDTLLWAVQNGWTDRHAVWAVNSGGSMLAPNGEYDWLNRPCAAMRPYGKLLWPLVLPLIQYIEHFF